MRLLVDGAMVWTGTAAPAFPGKVLIEGDRIVTVAPQSDAVSADGAKRIDADGKFLMPGMVEGHAHLSFVDTPRGTALGELPPEDHARLTMDAARKLLGAGFTRMKMANGHLRRERPGDHTAVAALTPRSRHASLHPTLARKRL